MPHMHLRGKDFLYTATYPDGRSEVLLSVPAYDFGWQSIYILSEPKAMPEGRGSIAWPISTTRRPTRSTPTRRPR